MASLLNLFIVSLICISLVASQPWNERGFRGMMGPGFRGMMGPGFRGMMGPGMMGNWAASNTKDNQLPADGKEALEDMYKRMDWMMGTDFSKTARKFSETKQGKTPDNLDGNLLYKELMNNKH